MENLKNVAPIEDFNWAWHQRLDSQLAAHPLRTGI